MEDKIVITGMSGRFPESDDIAEFSHNLLNKIDIVTENNKRWEPGLHGLPRCMGQLKDISKFDAGFFGVHHKQAHQLDPQARMLLELTHEAILDAGYDPEELRGRTIGVFIGNCSSESDEHFTLDPKKINGYAMTGCCRAMFANRISYTFDFKGPSFLVDTACSSGALALYEAVQAMRNGECEAAIVGGANLTLRPGTALQFYKLNMLSDDGKCKSFDAACNGYGRSEAVVSLFLQKADAARRVYASIVHIKTNTDGYKEQGVTFPSAKMQKRLIEEVYEECQIDPSKVSYVEAHGTGTPAGDPIEMSAIADVFCKDRNEPLLVGSVKSNMGHSEPSSGLCSVVKVLIGMESGLIPPNLHFKSPNPEIPALVEGRVKIVTDPLPWKGGYAAVSCFGFGGVNVHALLKSNPDNDKSECTSDNKSKIPQLALHCGRTEESVQLLFDYLENHSVNRDFFALLHKSAYLSPQMKQYRGFKIVDSSSEATAIKHTTVEKRPVWYIFSGMGTQWPCMAKDLMNLDVFADSIYESAKVLKPYGLDLIDLVTNGAAKKENGRAIIPAFVSIAAVQVALVDVLTAIGITPDGIVGHSVGELGCAYADGCFTGEQMVMAAYWRGKAVEESNLEDGAMAALGITWNQAKERCPEAVFPSCHNAEDSVTISGPKEDIKKFVETLKAENVFAREVDSCGYAFHSQYIFPAAGKLQKALEGVIPNPKRRTERWISSSFPKENWDEASTKLADASYFVHNLVSPVLFHEALHHVPEDAIVIEIAPHHLLQAILKRVIGPKAEYIGLMKRNVDNTLHLLSSIGRLYTSGLNPKIENLYPEVTLPVQRGTPMISPLIKWDHSESWCVAKWGKNGHHSQMIVEVDVGSADSNDSFLLGHCIDGRHLYPATGYLMLVWKALAELKNKEYSTMPVVFEEVKIKRATVLSKTAVTKFLVDITSAGGEFEISEAGMTVATGRIYTSDEIPKVDNIKYWKDVEDEAKLNSSDVYKELRLRGYDYGPTFQGVVESDLRGEQGLLKWTGEWVVFLDNILQFSMLGTTKRALCLPTRIQSIKINPLLHSKVVDSVKELEGIPIIHEKYTKRCIAGGVEIKNLKASIAPRQQCRQVPLLEEYHFVPHNEPSILSKSQLSVLEKYVHVCSSVSKKILELAGKNKDQITDVMNGFSEVDENIISSYLKTLSEEHVLLRNLQDILHSSTIKDLNNAAKLSVTNYLQEKEKDLLETTMVEETPLRTVLDIIIENATSRKLKVFEICNEQLPFSAKIHNLLQMFHMLQWNYTVAHPSPNGLNKDMLTPGKIQTVQFISSSKSTPDAKDIDLLVAKNLNCSKKDLKSVIHNLSSVVKPGGFVLFVQRTRLVPAELFLSALGDVAIPTHSESDLEQIFKDLNLVSVCKKSDALASSMYLLRKACDTHSITDSVVAIKTGKYSEWVDKLKTEIQKAQASPEKSRIWLVAENESSNGIIGLVNCLRQEPGGSTIKCVFTDAEGSLKLPEFDKCTPYYKDILKNNLTMNVYKKGAWGSYRHLSANSVKSSNLTEHAYLNVMTRGDLSSLQWIDSPLKYFSPDTSIDQILCQVYYAPLNFRDVMLASGKLPADAIPGDLALQDCILGLEFSGRTMDGKRVMGLVPSKGLATTVAADPDFVWEVPDGWTLEEASTVPVAYSTAYYALLTRGNLKKSEKILIHSGSGGVGQAAIAIALSLGCEVFTTVGSNEKREFLKKRYPELKDENFCNSRDTSFEQDILNATNGEGVDVILNSLADEKLKASLCCLAQHGRFLEIGKYDLSNNSPLGMAIFLKNIAFHGILLDALFESGNYCIAAKKGVVQLVKEGIQDGTVKPLNSILFNNDQAEQAFRFMASGRHIGKVVLKIKEEEPQKIVLPTPTTLPALLRTSCHPEKTYIIIGGLGGFGLELCEWLIERGAQNIVLTSRSGVNTGYQHLCLRRWKKASVNVVVSKLNAAKYNDAKQLLQTSSSYGVIGGIFNLALVLRDAFMENQTVGNYQAVCESKVQSTKNLDELSRDLCPELEWFVCFSSVSCGRGNAGQSNYGFANSVMERLCERRNKEGLPGLAIQWGAVGDVGVIQDTIGAEVVIGGTVPQRITSCLTVLDQFLQQKHPVVSSFVPYRPADSAVQKATKNNVLATVANVFGIKDLSNIKLEASLGELGMDSLIGVEIQQFLERERDLVLSIQELRQMKIIDLKKLDGDCDAGKEESSDKDDASKTKDDTSKFNKYKELSLISIQHLVPKDPLVLMNTSGKGIPLFIVHPIEGVVDMLNTLAQLLHTPVYGLQYTSDAPSTSVEDLASWYLNHIKKLNINGAINLVGYSFGASVAFEMALQAERKPEDHPSVITLVMLDGSPALVTTYTREHESHFLIDSQTEGEAQALCAFSLQFKDTNIRELKKELLKLSTFEERVSFVAEKIITACPDVSKDDVSLAADLYYKKLIISIKYTPKYKLKRDVILLKASDAVDMAKNFSEHYDLEKVCDGTITVHTIKGTHKSFIQGDSAKETSRIINAICQK